MPVGTFVNPEIIMGYKSPDFSALDPSRMAANALAFRQARTQEQANALALQQKQQEAADQALLQEAANQSDPVNYLRGRDRLDLANTYAGLQQEQQGKKLQFQTQEQALEDAKRKAANEQLLALAPQRYAELQNVSTPEQYRAWHLANPEPYGTNKADTTTRVDSVLAQEGGLDRLKSESKSALETILGIKPAETKQFQPTAFESEFALYKQDPAAYRRFKEAQKVETGGGATAGTTQIPKLKQGERWNPDLERVEQVPGSVEYNKQSKLHATDYSSLDTVKSITKANVENVDELLKAANAWATETNNGAKPLGNNASEDAKAFANLFPGSYTGYVTQYKSGTTATLKAKYQKLQSNAKNLGLQQTRVGGSIGTITEREWPMLQQQVLSLSPTMETAAAAAEIANIKNRFIDTQNLAADKYDTQWGETQYYKGAPATSAENSQIKNEAIKTFKSYEPDKYEYRINPSTGKVQRKAK